MGRGRGAAIAVTLDGIVKIQDGASSVLEKITGVAETADQKLTNLGQTMDKMGSTKGTAGLKTTQTAIKDVGQQAKDTATGVTISFDEMKRRVSSATRGMETDSAKLKATLEALDGVYRVELEGKDEFVEMTALARVLKSELNSLQRKQAKSALGGAGLGLLSAGGGSTGGGASTLSKMFEFPAQMLGRWGLMIGMFTAAVPVIESVVGVLGVLASSLASAAGGAVIVGGAGIGGFVASLALIGPTAAMTVSRLGQASQALTAYNQAVQLYGAGSSQAALAKKKMDPFQHEMPTVQALQGFKAKFARLNTGSSDTFLETIRTSLRDISQHLLPSMAHWSQRAFAGLDKGAGNLISKISSPDFKKSMDVVSKLTAHATPVMGNIFGNMAKLFIHITAAAKPEIMHLLREFNTWLHGLADNTSNIAKTRKELDPLFKDMHAWGRLLKQTGILLGTIIGQGRQQGRGLVAGMTQQIVEWRKSLEKDPAKLKGWFREMIDNFQSFAQAAKTLAETFLNLVHALKPLTLVLAKLVGGLGQTQPLGGSGPNLLDLYLYGSLGKFALGKVGKTAMGGKLLSKIPGLGRLAGGATATRTGTGIAGGLGRVAPAAAGMGGGTALAVGAAAGTSALGIKGTIQDIASGGIGTAAAKAAMFSVMGPGALVGRGLRELPLVGKAIGGIEDHVSSLAHKVPVVGDVFDTVFGSGGEVEKSIDNASDAVRGGNKAVKSLEKQTDTSNDSVGQAIKSMRDKYGSLVNAGHEMGSKQRKVWIDMAQNARESGDISQKTLRMLTNAFTNNSEKWRNQLDKVSAKTGESTEKWKKALGGAAAKISDDYTGMVEVTGGGLDMLVSNTNSLLKPLGISQGIQFSAHHLSSGSSKGIAGSGGAHPHVGHPNMARGGMIAGRGQRDTVHLGGGNMAAPGEWVVNQHTTRKINDMLRMHGTTLEHEVWGEGRKHNMPAPLNATYGRKLARGGQSGGILAAGRLGEQMGLSVGEGPGPFGPITNVHVAGSYHYKNEAVDASGSAALMRKYFLAVQQGWQGKGLAELFYDPMGYYIKNDAKVAGAIGGHTDHVHVAILGNALGGGAANMELAKVMLKGPKGALKDIGQGVLDKSHGALQKYINKKAGAMGGVDIGPGKGQYNAQSGAKLWKQAGGPSKLAHIMGAVMMAESGGDPNIVNSIGASGLWQILMPANASYVHGNVLDPGVNAQAAVAIYQAQGLSAWEAYTNGAYQQFMSRGGRMGGAKGRGGGPLGFGGQPAWGGWNKRGGSFTVHGPTIFGAGEAGAERVTVSAKNNSSAGPVRGRYGPVSVHIDKIEFKKDGDIEKTVKKEFEKFARHVSTAGVEDAGGLI